MGCLNINFKAIPVCEQCVDNITMQHVFYTIKIKNSKDEK